MAEKSKLPEKKEVEILKIPTGEKIPQGAIPVESIFGLVVSRLSKEANAYLNEWLSLITQEQRERFRLVVALAVQYVSVKNWDDILGYGKDIIVQLIGPDNVYRPINAITAIALRYGLIEELRRPGKCVITLAEHRHGTHHKIKSTFECTIDQNFTVEVELPGVSGSIKLGTDDLAMVELNIAIIKGSKQKTYIKSILLPDKIKAELVNGKEIEIDGKSVERVVFEGSTIQEENS